MRSHMLIYLDLSKRQWLHNDIELTGSNTPNEREILYIQLCRLEMAPLLNKYYWNEDILTGQNPPLKYSYPLELLAQFWKGLDLSMFKIWGL